MNETTKQLTDIIRKKHALTENLVGPARAAVNQMIDAGMKRGADPLAAVLFEIDSLDQQLKDVMNADPEKATLAILEMLIGPK